MKNALLAFAVLLVGLISFRSYTHATPQKTEATQRIEVQSLSSFDMDRINGIVDERIDPTVSRINEELANQDSRLDSLEAQLSDAVAKITDCSTRTSEMIAAQSVHKTNSGGGSTGNSTRNIYQSTSQTVRSSGGGSTGNPVQNAYTVVSETPIVQSVQSQPILSRTVTRTQTAAASAYESGDCPGGVCPTSYGSQTSTTKSSTFALPRLRIFRR